MSPELDGCSLSSDGGTCKTLHGGVLVLKPHGCDAPDAANRSDTMEQTPQLTDLHGQGEEEISEKRLVRKLDLSVGFTGPGLTLTSRRIMPLLCISYLLNYIDRTNLGNARTLNNEAKDGSTMNEMYVD